MPSGVVRCVANFISSTTIEIVKEFNPQSLDGITDWSHCWILFVGTDGEMGLLPFEISRVDGRRLELITVNGHVPSHAKIIDIKPIHACDIS
jgi:tRNA (Thr-GGU) A37 N-methylase